MGKKLYVGNLPFSATEDSLKEAFSRFGTVESVNIIMDRDTGQSKGFGFIELSTKQEAAEAIVKMNSAEMDGRTLKVSEALPQTPRDGGGARGGYGGGGRGGGYGGGGGGGFRR
jgi:RNA recognition motif-containing protein